MSSENEIRLAQKCEVLETELSELKDDLRVLQGLKDPEDLMHDIKLYKQLVRNLEEIGKNLEEMIRIDRDYIKTLEEASKEFQTRIEAGFDREKRLHEVIADLIYKSGS